MLIWRLRKNPAQKRKRLRSQSQKPPKGKPAMRSKSKDYEEKRITDNQKILGFPQKMLHWFIYVLLGSVVLTAVGQLFGLPSAVANIENRVDVLEIVAKENKRVSQELLKAMNDQNLINNDMLKGVQNISKQTERTNKLLTDINTTQSKLISKSVEQEVRVTNLERQAYK